MHIFTTKQQLKLRTSAISDYFNMLLTELMKNIADFFAPSVEGHSTCTFKIRHWNLSRKKSVNDYCTNLFPTPAVDTLPIPGSHQTVADSRVLTFTLKETIHSHLQVTFTAKLLKLHINHRLLMAL